MPSKYFNEIPDPSKWDQRFFSMCHLIASWSEDKSRQVGAVIIGPDKEVRSIGFNGLPRGIFSDIEKRHSSKNGEKYYWFEHAERNAIYNAARAGIATKNCEMYCTVFPCSDCLRAIIQSGIIKLHTYLPPEKDPHFHRSFEVSIEMAREVGLEVFVYTKD
ncbi:MAG: deaminase [Rhodobacteraceae bacterium]|nr:deaminase [Paracoccaceae bacterium]